MKAPISWLADFVAFDEPLTGRTIADALIRAGLEVETVTKTDADLSGPIVVGRVVSYRDEPQKNGKTIRWCRVDVGPEHNAGASEPDDDGGSRGIVCGAHNFAVGDFVVVSLPGAVLPGGFAIAARKTYGHISDGMICSMLELGIGDDHEGILVLPPTDDDGRPLAPGQDALALLGLRDEVLDIAVTPDLGYCLSIRGLARETAQAFGLPYTDPVDRPTPPPTADGFAVRSDTAGCPLFVALTVEGVDPARPSPQWIQSRVRMGGMRSISLAVDITNLVMLEFGQPIHAYDANRLSGGIVVRQARPGESLVTLDGQDRVLDAEDIVITDDSGVIGLGGVMGGESTEITDTTTKIVIEAAHFDPVAISRTARRHKLPSEASKRFERGVDANAAYSAAHRVASLLVQYGGGRLGTAETVVGAVPAMPEQTIRAALPQEILGTPVPADRVVDILRASGVTVTVDGDHLHLVPPSWRPDLRDPYDYVEEVGCKVGLDTIEPVVPRAPGGRGLSARQKARRALSAALPGAGFVEVLQFPFASSGDLDRLGLPDDDPRRALVRLVNPLADTSPYLRTTLLPGLFAAVARNRSRGLDDLALYEVGAVFRGPTGVAPIPSVAGRPSETELAAIEAALPNQPVRIACVVTGAWRAAGWDGPAQQAGWQQAIAFAQTAARVFGVTLDVSADRHAPYHPGRCAELSVGGVHIGHAGELHPTVCQAFGLPERTAAAEFSFEELLAVAPGAGSITPISTWPVAKEDVALIVDDSVPVADVAAALVDGAGDLLESIHLFDVYTGDQVGQGKKSLAFALRFRASDRTLKDTEAAGARDAATASAVERCGAVPRIG